jgi:hypothetical protein
MDIAGVIWLAVFGLVIAVAVLAGGVFICKVIYALMYDNAVPWDHTLDDWKENSTHPNWHLEKEFKRKFWTGVAVIVIALATASILFFD